MALKAVPWTSDRCSRVRPFRPNTCPPKAGIVQRLFLILQIAGIFVGVLVIRATNWGSFVVLISFSVLV